MHKLDAIEKSSPRTIDENFKRRAPPTSRAAADGLLACGRTVSYREKDTRPGHVIRRHPDGRIELVKIDLGLAATSRRPA